MRFLANLTVEQDCQLLRNTNTRFKGPIGWYIQSAKKPFHLENKWQTWRAFPCGLNFMYLLIFVRNWRRYYAYLEKSFRQALCVISLAARDEKLLVVKSSLEPQGTGRATG